MPDMIETKIALSEASYKILMAATDASNKFTTLTFKLRRKCLDNLLDLRMEHYDRWLEDNAKNDEPVNWSLTEAGTNVIQRSLTDTANLYVVDSYGNCTHEELTR